MIGHPRVVAAAKFTIGCAILLSGFLAPAPASPNLSEGSPEILFGAGERLVFSIEWNPPAYLFFIPAMEAGQATLILAGETQHQNRRAFKIVLTAHSSGLLAKLAGMTVDDYYEFITDADTFCTYDVVKREREGKRMRDIEITYNQEPGKLHVREIDVTPGAHRVLRDKDYEGIPPCVRDLISALYSIRRNKFEIGSSSRMMVAENQVVKEVEMRVMKKERINTQAGSYGAWQIDTVAVLGGLFKNGGQFRIWLSADERQIPVKFEAKVSLGKVTGILKEAQF
jgi:hypothetical protein